VLVSVCALKAIRAVFNVGGWPRCLVHLC
jgi:transposase-like protein